MSLTKWGLLFNFIGSIFLGLHIVDEKLLKSFEIKLKNLPASFLQWLFMTILLPVLAARTRRQLPQWSGGPKRWASKILTYLDIKIENGNGHSWPIKQSLFLNNPYSYFLIEGILIGTVIYLVLSIVISPILLPISIAISLISKTQRIFRIKSIFGLLGIVLLIIGFSLQFFSK